MRSVLSLPPVGASVVLLPKHIGVPTLRMQAGDTRETIFKKKKKMCGLVKCKFAHKFLAVKELHCHMAG